MITSSLVRPSRLAAAAAALMVGFDSAAQAQSWS